MLKRVKAQKKTEIDKYNQHSIKKATKLIHTTIHHAPT